MQRVTCRECDSENIMGDADRCESCVASAIGAEWFNGSAILDTGRRIQLHGATWRVCEYAYGMRTGEELLRPV